MTPTKRPIPKITQLLLAGSAVLLASGFTSNFDGYCESAAKRYSADVEVCSARETHHRKEATNLRTWVTSDDWMSCERSASSFAGMESCLRRHLGNRGPARKPWRPPVASNAANAGEMNGSTAHSDVLSAPTPPGQAADGRHPATFGTLAPGKPSTATFPGAAKAGDVQALDAHLANGQKIDEPFEDGKTALHYAAMWGRYDAVEFLLSHGANRNAVDDFGRTPAVYARERRYREVQTLLK
jgi:hypothetical protein